MLSPYFNDKNSHIMYYFSNNISTTPHPPSHIKHHNEFLARLRHSTHSLYFTLLQRKSGVELKLVLGEQSKHILSRNRTAKAKEIKRKGDV